MKDTLKLGVSFLIAIDPKTDITTKNKKQTSKKYEYGNDTIILGSRNPAQRKTI